MANRILWAADQASAYLVDDQGNYVGKWFANHPELSNFDPFTYGGGPSAYGGYGGTAAGATGQPGYVYGGGGGGAGGGHYQDPDRLKFDEGVREFNLTYDQLNDLYEANHAEAEERLALDHDRLEQDAANVRAQIASSEGMQRERLQAELQQLQMQIASNESIANLDRASRDRIADQQLIMRLKEIQSNERLQAAQTWANPIDYLAYNKWLQGQQAMTTESGLPVGAPGWDTGLPGATPGQPEAATVGAGGAATTDVYGQQLGAGGRVAEFGAWGGPTPTISGVPWTMPEQTNLTQFLNTPDQAQQMAYARWRQGGGMTPATATQRMYAAAPTGTAKGTVAYG